MYSHPRICYDARMPLRAERVGQQMGKETFPADKFVEFFRCRNCNKRNRAPLSAQPLLLRILPNLSNGPNVVLACEACRDLRLYSADDLLPMHHYNRGEGEDVVYIEKFFHVEIACADSNCESRIEVIAPTPEVYNLASMKVYSLRWNPQNVVCDAGYPARKPISLVSIKELNV
jgi:hypothetical protein